MVPIIIIAAVPALSTLISWQRGLLIYAKRTTSITQAVALNVAILITTMFAGGALLPIPGVTTASIALTASVGAEWLYLRWRSKPVIRQLKLDGKIDPAF